MPDYVKAVVLRFGRRLIIAVSLFTLSVISIFEIGVFCRIPALSVTSWAFTSLTSWFLLLIIVCCGGCFLSFSPRNGFRSAAVAVLMTINLFGAAIIELNIAVTAQRHGISLNFLESFELPPSDTRTRISHVSYTKMDSSPLNLTIYRSDSASVNHSQPVLIYVHGGGWVSGSADARQADLKWFAQQGWVVFAVGYSLSTNERHLWDVTTGQIACSMAWVGAHATQFGGDPSRLYMTGESAGGNLVVNASYMANANRLRSSCGGSVPHVRAIVAAYPVVDAGNVYKNSNPILGGSARSMLNQYIGGPPERYPARYKSINPIQYLISTSPPTMILVGEQDNLVSPQPTYDFVDLARSEGVQVELIRVPFMDHAFDVFPGSLGNQLYRRGAAKFMRQH